MHTHTLIFECSLHTILHDTMCMQLIKHQLAVKFISLNRNSDRLNMHMYQVCTKCTCTGHIHPHSHFLDAITIDSYSFLMKNVVKFFALCVLAALVLVTVSYVTSTILVYNSGQCRWSSSLDKVTTRCRFAIRHSRDKYGYTVMAGFSSGENNDSMYIFKLSFIVEN